MSMGAVALLLQLKARSGGHESIDQALAKLAKVPTAAPPMPSSEPAFAAALTLNQLSSLADNARRAESMGAVPMLVQLKARSGGEELIDQVLAKLAQVPSAPPQMPSNEPVAPVFAAAASAAPAPVPASAHLLAPGSLVRLEGLQGRPELNGRTGVISGELPQANMLRSC
jgi:hypothetical protein